MSCFLLVVGFLWGLETMLPLRGSLKWELRDWKTELICKRQLSHEDRTLNYDHSFLIR